MPIMKKLVSHSLEETDKIAADWLAEMAKKHASSKGALVVGLSGHLGVGKTAFVKSVAKSLGIRQEITSPTFVIMKIYDLPLIQTGLPWKKLIHIDAYRLEQPSELDAIQFNGLKSDQNNIIMVEWPENVELKSPELLQFKALSENQIEIKL